MQCYILALSRMAAERKRDILAGGWYSVLIDEDIFEGWQELRVEGVLERRGYL